MKANNSIYLGVGNISLDKELSKYYHDYTPAIIHIENEEYARLDSDGLPFFFDNGESYYSPVLIIQYGLMCYDLMHDGIDTEKNLEKFYKCVSWLEKEKKNFKDAYVWPNMPNKQYELDNGWISGMYQGQAISLYLRAYQHSNYDDYLSTSTKIFAFFKYDYSEGGVKRIDEKGFVWFEEYPTNKPSYVLNGFIYTVFGILDFYRVTKNEEAKILYESCINTLLGNIKKYDVWYWSIYDQLKKQLVSYYYQKNVHIPLMKILFGLTNNNIFNHYANKWERNLNSRFCQYITKFMYRIKHRISF